MGGTDAGEGCYLVFVLYSLFFVYVLFQKHRHLHVFLEVVAHGPGIHQQQGAYTHQQQHQRQADHRGNPSADKAPAHGCIAFGSVHN